MSSVKRGSGSAEQSGTSCMTTETISDLDAYFAREARRGTRYAGQLDPNFQAALADRNASVARSDCGFLQALQLPDGSVVPGAWDLRDHEDAWLGSIPLWDKRVLLYGAGWSWIAAHIAARARALVVLDLPPGEAPPPLPLVGDLPQEALQANLEATDRVRSGFWFAKKALGFDASVVHGDYADPPLDLGLFDATVLPFVLSQCPNPYGVLKAAASTADEAIVITELLAPAPEGLSGTEPAAVAVFAPLPLPEGVHFWWNLTPYTVCRMAITLGFSDVSVTAHNPPKMNPSPQLYTVVARRPAAPRAEGAAVNGASASSTQSPAGRPVEDLPLPPPEARFRVAGTDDLSVFLTLGERGYKALSESLRRAGSPLESLGRVLDFGCGVGRVLRYWRAAPGMELYGSDIDPDAIAWASANFPIAQFQTNTLEPRLDYPDGRFDLVYALSVFTHLTEDLQMPWLNELLRIIRPGGLLYFTTHGATYRHMLNAAQVEQFDKSQLVVVGAERPGSNYCGAFHPEDFVREVMIGGTGSELVEYVPKGALGNPDQDSWLIRKARD
jgi:SAM-dependent methyltransferase